MSETINHFARDALEQFGLSETSAKKYTSTLGAMLKSMGIATNQAAEMSNQRRYRKSNGHRLPNLAKCTLYFFCLSFNCTGCFFGLLLYFNKVPIRLPKEYYPELFGNEEEKTNFTEQEDAGDKRKLSPQQGQSPTQCSSFQN